MAKRDHHGYDTLEETEFNQTVNRDEEEELHVHRNCGKDYQACEERSLNDSVENKDTATNDDDPPITVMVIIELLVCIMCLFGRGMVMGSVGPTLIDLREVASLSVSQAAWIFLSQLAGHLIGSLMSKKILQELNNEFGLSMFLFSQSIFSALIPATKSSVLMCLMFVGQGLTLGIVSVGVFAICIRIGGKKRNGMFIQAVCLGTTLGGVFGPLMARPFLSDLARRQFHTHNHRFGVIHTSLNQSLYEVSTILPDTFISSNTTILPEIHHLSYNSTSSLLGTEANETGKSRVNIYYLIMAAVLFTVGLSFLAIFLKNGDPVRNDNQLQSESADLSFRECTAPLTLTIVLILIEAMLYFSIEIIFANLLTSFAVLGPLHFGKTNGAYLSSIYWGAMCFGRLNGVWIARYLSPFKMLISNLAVGSIAALVLSLGASKSAEVLWCFTAILGLSLATMTGSTVTWAAKHLPGNTYILSMIMATGVAGTAILAPSVSVLFNVAGPMALMYFILTAFCVATVVVSGAQYLLSKFGIEGKLYNKSETFKRRKIENLT